MTGIEFTPFIWAVPVAVAMFARDSTKSEVKSLALKHAELKLEGDGSHETPIEVTLEETRVAIILSP